MNKYEIIIVELLLKKYYKRKANNKVTKINRKIDLSPEKVLKNYSAYNVNVEEKEFVNKAIKLLESEGIISAVPLKFSSDYQKIYLIEEKIEYIEEYAKKIGITPRTFVIEELQDIIKKYQGKGNIIDFYISEIEKTITNSSVQLDSKKEEDILKALLFLEENNDVLYLREASLLIYGDSKYLEIHRKTQICSVISRYLNENGDSVFEDENLFERFNIYDTDQDICIKGPATITFNGKMIEIEGLSGGISFSIKDIDKINNISVNCEKVITVENKTSFLRMNDKCCYIYLGGFATKSQITFIKKIISDNPEKEYLHFGDIDAGGFWIHEKLCIQTKHDFRLFHMSISELEDEKYSKCLKPLTDTDKKRLTNLMNREVYSDCVRYMLNKNVKLEQEIISLYLDKS